MPGLFDGTMLCSNAVLGNSTGDLLGSLEGIIDELIGLGVRLGSCGKIVGDRVESSVNNAFGIADG